MTFNTKDENSEFLAKTCANLATKLESTNMWLAMIYKLLKELADEDGDVDG